MRPVLVLRPQPGASATVEKARQLGLQAEATPLFDIEPVAWEAPEVGGFDGLLLTSANAVRHGGSGLADYRGLPAYAVGEATAAAAREAGFDIAATGNAGVDRLLGSIDADLKLLHLCGEDRREPRDVRQKITAVPVYRAVAVDRPNLQASGMIALIHSPRAGKRFAELVADRGTTAIVAISIAAAEAAGDGWESVAIAKEANDDALLALASSLCNKPAPE